MWAEKSDSEEEGAGPSIGSFAGTKRSRNKVDYTAAMNFVSGGIQGKEKVKYRNLKTHLGATALSFLVEN